MASPVIWGTVIINFCYNYFVFYCMTWMPAYFVEQRTSHSRRWACFPFSASPVSAIVACSRDGLPTYSSSRGGNAVFVRKYSLSPASRLPAPNDGVQSSSVDGALFWAIVSLSAWG